MCWASSSCTPQAPRTATSGDSAMGQKDLLLDVIFISLLSFHLFDSCQLLIHLLDVGCTLLAESAGVTIKEEGRSVWLRQKSHQTHLLRTPALILIWRKRGSDIRLLINMTPSAIRSVNVMVRESQLSPSTWRHTTSRCASADLPSLNSDRLM